MRLDHITECGWHLGLCRKPLQRLAKIPSALDGFIVELVLLAASGVNCGTWTLLLQLYGVVPAQKAFQISYWQSTPCPLGSVADTYHSVHASWAVPTALAAGRAAWLKHPMFLLASPILSTLWAKWLWELWSAGQPWAFSPSSLLTIL